MIRLGQIVKKNLKSIILNLVTLLAFLTGPIGQVRVPGIFRLTALSALAQEFSASALYAPEPDHDREIFQIAFSTYTAVDIFHSTQVYLGGGLDLAQAPKPVFSLKEAPRKIIVPGSSIAGNAKFTLVFDNPSASIISQANIYDITGTEVADFTEETPSGNDPSQLSWNGRASDGSLVRSGIYIYQVQVEGEVINGTVVVAK